MNLMISKKTEPIFLSSKTAFYIVGKKKLQNELMASCIHHKTGYECFVFKTLKSLPKNQKRPRLVSWDFQKKYLEDMMSELKRYNTQKKSNDHIVLFNVSANLKFHKSFILNGIQGVFYEQDTLENFIKGISAILNGKLWFPRETLTRCILEETIDELPLKSMVEKLTQRQVEILSMVAVGTTNQEIAKKLYISPNTVKNHLYNIFQKINVSNRIQAALWATTNL